MYSEKRARKRVGVAILSLIMAVMLLSPGINSYAEDTEGNSTTYYDGTYEGTGQGHKGNVTVSVTIADGKIAEINEVSQEETSSYWEKAKALFDIIKSAQTTEVDSITGATRSSNGIKEAVNDALAKASVNPEGWYTSGDGTARDPYLIESSDQLSKFATIVDEGEDFAGQYVVLGADIDLSGIESWNPIGSEGATASSNKFAGTFNGKGHTIKGMKIRGTFSSETNVGLFASVDNTAVIKNIHLTDVSVDITGSGVLRAGGIAGDTVNGTADAGTLVDRCSVAGTISADSSGQALVFSAGIIGRAMTWVKVSNSWSYVNVSAISRGGNNSGYAGGVYGMSGNNTLIVNCASFGESYGCSPKSTNFGGMAGGLGGMLTSKVYNVYAMGNATIGNGGTTHKWVGALAGEFPSGGMTKQTDGSYLYPDTGAFRDFGYYANDISLKIEKWNGSNSESEETELRATGTSTKLSTIDKVFEDKAVAMTRVDMATQDFADTLNANLKETRKLLDAYGYTDIELFNWKVTDSVVLPLGDKWVNKDPDPGIFAGGEGTEEDPYQIETEDQLRAFASSLTEGIDYDGIFIKLTADVDISSADWTPIGGQDFAFNGTFDGTGHKVSGMHAGSEDSPYVMGADNPYMGFFGVLGKDAVVKELHLTNVDIYASTPQYVYLGGIAAINDADSTTKQAIMIDGCSVTGKMTVTADKSNAFLGGIIASQYRGAVINCWTDMDLKCTVKTGNAIAEVGGLVALNNRGLVANSYTFGDVYGSASRNNGDEGMASTGNLVGVQAGDLVGCYSKGNNTTGEYSVYAGEVAGWITGIGKAYSCYYNKEAKMVIDGREVNPPADFGTKVAPGVNEEGDAYVGGIVDELVAYTSSDYSNIADKLNAKFIEYPTDLSVYGIQGAMLRQWKYDSAAQCVVLSDTKAETTYKQPQAEIVPAEVEELRDGTYYGRDPEKKLVVKINVENHEIVGEPEVISGDSSDEEVYQAALSKARSKALYGDITGYGSADTSLFDGGEGTKKNPYLISDEKQLRYIAEALNEDESFKNVWFKQTADIDVSSKDWLPIGFGIMAKVKKAWTQVAVYPFQGNYDGDNYSITGLTIGSADTPSANPLTNYTAGLFGIVSGDHNSNEKITDDVRICRLENIKLRDVDIHVSSESQNFTAALVANAQNGFLIDNCSAEGKLSSYSKDSFARGGGIAGNVLRGTVLNTWANVRIKAETDAGNSYAGGLYAMDNRVTSINCFSLGNITGNAAANNKVHIGGLCGQAGGIHYNCYTTGDITSLKTTSDAGLVEGRLAGIAVDSKVYYCSKAVLTVADTVKEAQAVGVSVPENNDIQAKTEAEIGSQEFVDLLNENAQAATENVNSLQDIINAQTDLTHIVQFSGDADLLAEWTLDKRPVFKEKNKTAEVSYKVTFKFRNGRADKTVVVENGKTVNKPDLASSQCKKPTGWFTDEACTKAYDFNEPISSDLTLYCGWEGNHTWKKTYTVDKKATNARAGSKSIHCSVCNAVKPGSAVSIPRLKVKGTTLLKVKGAKKSFKARWRKGSAINGYQLRYALNKEFTKGRKVVQIIRPGTVMIKVKKLKARKKYYVSIRTFKIYKGKKYYSAWSKAKKVKIKK